MPSRIILGIGIGTLAGHKEMFCVVHKILPNYIRKFDFFLTVHHSIDLFQ
jgi:hypothetical protein